MNANAHFTPDTYTPGYAWPKRLMIIFGVLLLTLGTWHLAVPIRLLAFGTRATAEAVAVVKTKPGLPDAVFRDDTRLKAALESRDRSYIFWNEFQFNATGVPTTVRAPVGSQLKPIYPLSDADGLPTTTTVYFDPHQPGVVLFPDIVSTWFAAGALVLMGFITTGVGCVLLYWADKPIELPHLPPEPAKNVQES